MSSRQKGVRSEQSQPHLRPQGRTEARQHVACNLRLGHLPQAGRTKPKIIELREDFKRKPKAARIAGCKTWTEFCQKKLHRTDRAVQKLLADKATPAKPKPGKPQTELSSGAEEKKGGDRDWPTMRKIVAERVCEELKPYAADTLEFRQELVELLDRIARRFGMKIVAEQILAEAKLRPVNSPVANAEQMAA